MPTITSRVHPRTVSSVLRLVADWTAGIWDLSSLAFTIPTGLAGPRTTTLSSLPAFRTCYGPPCLSAQGQSRDLQHSSPMLARCGNIALRDIAHMLISPIQSNVPHLDSHFLTSNSWGNRVLIFWCSKQRPSNHRCTQEGCQGKRDLSLSVKPCGASSLSPAGILSRFSPAPALDREGLSES
jgi:hypothetical protein